MTRNTYSRDSSPHDPRQEEVVLCISVEEVVLWVFGQTSTGEFCSGTRRCGVFHHVVGTAVLTTVRDASAGCNWSGCLPVQAAVVRASGLLASYPESQRYTPHGPGSTVHTYLQAIWTWAQACFRYAFWKDRQRMTPVVIGNSKKKTGGTSALSLWGDTSEVHAYKRPASHVCMYAYRTTVADPAKSVYG